MVQFNLFAQTDTADKQKVTKVKGVVIDGDTKEPLPFVNVFFEGASVGTTTDFDGKYSMSSQWATDKLSASFVGYDDVTHPVILGKNQTIDFELSSGATLQVVEVKVKKRQRYRKKGNPAIELAKNVIKNKDRNRLKGQEHFEYDKYEKVELDVNNLTDKFRKRKVFKKFQFIFDHVDTSAINGKPFLPVYIQETSSKVFFRKNPKSTREHRKGIKMSGLDEYWDNEGVVALMDVLYQDINIYDNKINILDLQFVSPLNPIGPIDFYRYYIIDTVDIGGQKCIDLGFIPKNKLNFGFVGNLYITADTNYTVKKVKMGIVDDINMNWVEDLEIEQEFELADSIWILNKDRFVIDFKVSKKSMGFFGRKNVFYTNYVFNKPRDKEIYNTSVKVKDDENAFEKPDDFWAQARPVPLEEGEKAVYHMIDTIQEIPAFKNTMDVLRLFFTGYYTFGPVDVGPLNGIYSFNDIDGSRIRIGGETNLRFHKQIKLEGTVLTTLKTKKWRYGVSAEYSFNKDFEVNPRHRIKFSFQHDINFPGQHLNLVNEDNFLLSFKRGVVDKLILFDSYKIDYLKEFTNNLSYQLIFEHREQQPLGDFDFNYSSDGGVTEDSIGSLNTTDFGIKLRWAPNEQFVQGRAYRYAIYNKYPVFTLKYNLGAKVLGGDYTYNRVSFEIFKKWNFSILGYAHSNLEVGKVFGEVPYLLAFLPRANQTYAYQTHSYNMMNFLEFVNDEYISFNVRYYMNGFIFNKIPLFRKLKLREVVSFKMLYGRLTDKNNPDRTGNENLIQFPEDMNGDPTTSSLVKEPYMEASVGISNIFKVLTFDLVKRLNYLDGNNVPSVFGVKGLGIRFRAGLEF